MAENQQGNPQATTNTFNKGMLKDYNETFVGEGQYTHARNAVNNSHDGQVGIIGNEPSNINCVNLPYTLIGTVHLGDDQWAVFTTDDLDSEIGIFDESACTYQKQLNSKCLNFRKSNLITGVFRRRYDCERLVYWDDGRNPTRVIDIDNVQQYFNYVDTYVNNCRVRNYLNTVNCESLRLAPLITHPCLTIKKGKVPGTLPNGSYQACIAYTVNQVKVTDYLGLTAVQPIWSHDNVNGSLEIIVTDIDRDFDEFELVILSNVNAQTVAKRIGYYSTSQGIIHVDRWNLEFVNVSVADIVFRSEAIEKSDAMYSINNYLLRVGTYSKFKFNYQPLANQIRAKWVAVQYPNDYYEKGNNKTGYLRDEVYSFFIRFVYNTGEFSESYHIPGRAPLPGDEANITGIANDAFETTGPSPFSRKVWQVKNTAIVDSNIQSSPSYLEGGTIIASGRMAFWESEEYYPDNNPTVWGNLCGKKIRHHKMPDETVDNFPATFDTGGPGVPGGTKLVLLGVAFENIAAPLDNNGNPIESIVGYQILRGSREGNKSIIAKGIICNMRDYPIPGNTQRGLFQNYPYNDLRPDPYLTTDLVNGTNGDSNGNVNYSKMSSYRKDIFSFHSPDVTFSNPFLNVSELKIYNEYVGNVSGFFETPYRHPRFKVLANFVKFISDIVGAVAGVNIIAQGLEFTGTEDLPIAFTFPPLQPPPLPPAGGGVANLWATVLGWIEYAIRLALWVIITGALFLLAAYFTEVQSEKVMQIFRYLVPRIQYCSQFISSGFYNRTVPSRLGNRRRRIDQAAYISPHIQYFTKQNPVEVLQVNNLYRSKFAIVAIDNSAANIEDPLTTDDSRWIFSEAPGSTISAHHAALKINLPTQYGQLESIKQLPIDTCINPIRTSTLLRESTEVLFGGDIYVSRFTEKNTMFFFTTWLMGEPDETEYDYTLYINIPYPRHWINSSIVKLHLLQQPSTFRSLDARQNGGFLNAFYLSRGFFYLFNSGVREFFIESEVNCAYRDWDEEIAKRHYDPTRFTELAAMFRSDIIKSGNFYKYDYNLSINKLFNSSISWGNTLPRDYNPLTYESCFTYRPNRVIYSLPQQDENKKDNWRLFLTNNYKDFQSRVTSIKPINKTGGFFMMAYQSPLQFMGLEELKVDGTGAKLTIGDGGLFQQPMQAIVNTDASYEYGSNQSRFSSVNTLHGLFYVSQNQGKVFQYTGQLNEISNGGLKWWFSRYLPSQLLLQYPNYPLYDNPVKGVGVQCIYDNTNEILYITKKDYKPKFQTFTFDSDGNMFTASGVKINFDDKDYFEDASWTISYDPKSKSWVSFHDWIPTFLIPGKNHFLSVKDNSIWKHNVVCSSYCNFYGVDYPFEVEFVSATGQQVNSMRNLEYLLEVYTMYNNCRDKFHILDENFDQAMIYNSEQISGILELVLKSKNDAVNLLSYPQIGANTIKIQYSKEENKYRFNQFWDITKDRGEFASVNLPMLNIEPNGYKFNINPAYVNYSKAALERKKFRHNVNRIFLRKVKSGQNKYLFKISNQKILQSPR